MAMFVRPILEAVRQLPEPEFRGVLIKSVALAFAVFVVMLTVAMYFLSKFDYFQWKILDTLAQFAGGAGFLLVALILFPALSGVFISLFLDDIATAVEQKHYPADAPGHDLKLYDSLLLSLRFTVVMVLLNLVALPLYLLFLIVTPVAMALFYCLNGYLLAREYFELVSARHLDVKGVWRARKRNIWTIMPAGILLAFLMTVPVVNLIAPIIATAAMVHIFKELEASGKIA